MRTHDETSPDPGCQGEFLSSAEVGTALIDGNAFSAKPVQYTVVDGMALVEGDILLGPVEEVEKATAEKREELQSGDAEVIAHGVIISGDRYRWPNSQVPYVIADDLPNQRRVTDAIAHWEEHTNLRFIRRTTANAASFPDYVRFQPASGCSAHVGRRQTGEQHVNLANGCTLGNTIHEIGHAIGLWHEQSREDRDRFVRIHWENIEAGRSHNFNQHISDGDDVGAYDYASIMHYPRKAFSRNGEDTITPLGSGTVQIGQRSGLSAGDIRTVNHMYPRPPIVKLKVLDDRPIPKLKILDDRPIPKLKVLDDRPIPFPPFPPRPPLQLPQTGLSPFALATPHHAEAGAVGGAGEGTWTGSEAGDAALLAQAEHLEQQLAATEGHVRDLEAVLGHVSGRLAEITHRQQELLAAYQHLHEGMGQPQTGNQG